VANIRTDEARSAWERFAVIVFGSAAKSEVHNATFQIYNVRRQQVLKCANAVFKEIAHGTAHLFQTLSQRNMACCQKSAVARVVISRERQHPVRTLQATRMQILAIKRNAQFMEMGHGTWLLRKTAFK